MLSKIVVSCFAFGDRVLGSSGWLRISWDPLASASLPLKHWDYGHVPTSLVLCRAGDLTQGFMYAGQVLYQGRVQALFFVIVIF